MGNTGLRKLLSPLDMVETKYKDITEIPIMTLDKTITTIPQANQTIIVHYRNSVPQQILTELNSSGVAATVVLIPDSQNPHSFEQLHSKHPNSLGKANLNGSQMHPLFKYLKRKSARYYDRYLVGAKPIRQVLGAFYIDRRPEISVVEYYGESELGELVKKLKSTQTSQSKAL